MGWQPTVLPRQSWLSQALQPVKGRVIFAQPLDTDGVSDCSQTRDVLMVFRATDPYCCMATDPDMALSSSIVWDFTMASGGAQSTHNRLFFVTLTSLVLPLFIILTVLLLLFSHLSPTYLHTAVTPASGEPLGVFACTVCHCGGWVSRFSNNFLERYYLPKLNPNQISNLKQIYNPQ